MITRTSLLGILLLSSLVVTASSAKSTDGEKKERRASAPICCWKQASCWLDNRSGCDLGYEPALFNSMPEGMGRPSPHVLNVPCCKCSTTCCRRSDGASLSICEHKEEPLVWCGNASGLEAQTKQDLYACCDNRLREKLNDKHMEGNRSHFATAQGEYLVKSTNKISEKSRHGMVKSRFVYVSCPP